MIERKDLIIKVIQELVDKGYIEPDNLEDDFICAASSLVDDVLKDYAIVPYQCIK